MKDIPQIELFSPWWQVWLSEYCAAGERFWEEYLTQATHNQAAFGSLLRELYLGFEKAWASASAPVLAAQSPAAAPSATDWTTYLSGFMGVRPDSEAQPVRQPPRSA
ncbi:hypothetical protein [Paraburkholderia ferrariae]|uniref:hypothetical protein n=1 Tax=Paraburkholderia ferrariae TaxID=386056 RepID=UPI000485E84C|nr:hypothetical protein [Paraburkholderia ferrariae]